MNNNLLGGRVTGNKQLFLGLNALIFSSFFGGGVSSLSRNQIFSFNYEVDFVVFCYIFGDFLWYE